MITQEQYDGFFERFDSHYRSLVKDFQEYQEAVGSTNTPGVQNYLSFIIEVSRSYNNLLTDMAEGVLVIRQLGSGIPDVPSPHDAVR